MTRHDDAAIRLEGVTRRFGGKAVVDDLTLRIAAGGVFGFVGLNGAGKTTAIRMMVGLLAPNAGLIRVAGFDVPRQRAGMKQHVGYVPDRPHVYSWMRVGEAISFCASFYPKWNGPRVAELLKLLDLDPRKRIKHLSKGMAAKVSLILALGHDPEVLILDEPLSGLDPVVRDEFLEGLITAVAERNQTVLFSSHTLADVQRMADSVGLLHEGKLIFHRRVDELLETTKRVRAVLREPGHAGAVPPGVLRQEVEGRQWVLTLENFSRTQLEFLKDKNALDDLEVTDLSLEELFKEHIRACRAKETV
jgi:ABC-2 type transport system ATP-binding protein